MNWKRPNDEFKLYLPTLVSKAVPPDPPLELGARDENLAVEENVCRRRPSGPDGKALILRDVDDIDLKVDRDNVFDPMWRAFDPWRRVKTRKNTTSDIIAVSVLMTVKSNWSAIGPMFRTDYWAVWVAIFSCFLVLIRLSIMTNLHNERRPKTTDERGVLRPSSSWAQNKQASRIFSPFLWETGNIPFAVWLCGRWRLRRESFSYTIWDIFQSNSDIPTVIRYLETRGKELKKHSLRRSGK